MNVDAVLGGAMLVLMALVGLSSTTIALATKSLFDFVGLLAASVLCSVGAVLVFRGWTVGDHNWGLTPLLALVTGWSLWHIKRCTRAIQSRWTFHGALVESLPAKRQTHFVVLIAFAAMFVVAVAAWTRVVLVSTWPAQVSARVLSMEDAGVKLRYHLSYSYGGKEYTRTLSRPMDDPLPSGEPVSLTISSKYPGYSVTSLQKAKSTAVEVSIGAMLVLGVWIVWRELQRKTKRPGEA